MANMIFTNNAATTLASSITNVATSLTVATGTGALFPNPTGGQYFYVTLQNVAGTTIEIVKCTARSTDTLTIVRAQDGTTASAFSTADKVELRVVNANLANFGNLDSTNTWAAAQTMTTPLAAGSGGTGLSSPGTSGNVLTSNGSAWVSQAVVGYVGPVGAQVFTTSGTFTVPAGITKVKVMVVGGGAGSSGIGQSSTLTWSSSGGGGAGATCIAYVAGLTSGGTVSVTVGAAGAAGNAGNGITGPTNGTSGGTSSFGTYITCTGGVATPISILTTASGGAGGTVSTSGVSFTEWSIAGQAGGNCSGSINTSGCPTTYLNVAGAGGQNAPTIPSLYMGIAGLGANTGFNASSVAAVGTAAQGYGCGGGGNCDQGSNNAPGHAGVPGIVIVQW